MLLQGAILYTSQGPIQNGALLFTENGIQAASTASQLKESESNTLHFPSNYHIIPGLIDLQLHGLHGCDVMDASQRSMETLSKALPTEGVTSYLASTMTEWDAKLREVLHNVRIFCEKPSVVAECLGVYLEGPFIAPLYAGAQRNNAVIAPDIELFKKWQQVAGDQIKLVTLAPEQEGGIELVRYLSEQGVISSLGHSEANFEQAKIAFNSGCQTVTHLFNAMQALHHRSPSAVTAALLDPRVIVQLIVDGVHLHPAIVEMIYRLKGKEGIVLVSDAMSAKGCPDGEYYLGGQKVKVEAGTPRLENGTLAGSTLRMIDAVVNFMHYAKTDFATALYCATAQPAQMLNIDRKGQLKAGCDADIVVLNEKYEVIMTFCKGKMAYSNR